MIPGLLACWALESSPDHGVSWSVEQYVFVAQTDQQICLYEEI